MSPSLVDMKRLKELRLREERLTESIPNKIKAIDNSCEVIYLPNLIPTEKVKYISIAMEPSFNRWAGNESDAKRRVQNRFKNTRALFNRTSL